MEEEYKQCIHEFIEMNQLLKSPADTVFCVKNKEESLPGKSLDSIEDDREVHFSRPSLSIPDSKDV